MATRRTVGVWWVRAVTPDVVTANGFAGDAYPDGAVVAALPPGRGARGSRVARARMRVDTRQLTELLAYGGQVADAPPVVYAEHLDRAGDPVSIDLIAFLHDDAAAGARAAGLHEPPPGAVLTVRDTQRLGLLADRQVGAVRWVPGTGQVREIYVDPAYRRRRVATTLLFAAEAACAARGWPSLWADGVRTALGEALQRTWRWGTGRAAGLSHVAPPMTPAGEGHGRLIAPRRP